MTRLSSHQEFFKQTNQLADELFQIENQVKFHEQQLLSDISELIKAVQNMASSIDKGPVQDALKVYFGQTAAVLESWENKVNHYDAGLSFRKQFGDSLLIFVYGKVKAGKSSLGNFIACGRASPDEEWLEQLSKNFYTPSYFVGEINHALGEVINHKQGFQVGAEETTTCIQGFTVPGLTWVDSPGLHSVNIGNGDLAQKYVESADLIIYPMNSAQPGRKTDLKELEELLSKGKRILVLITRCDTLEQDVDDEGNLIESLIMKSCDSRRDQELYVQAELDELCQKLDIKDADTSVLTISVGYAESHSNSQKAMQESGMQELFNRLQTILYSGGIELKKKAPEENLQAFYRLLLAKEGELSFSRLLLPLNKAVEKLDELETQIEDLRRLATTSIEKDFAHNVNNLVDQYADSRNLKALEQELQQLIDNAISSHYREPLKKLYEDAVGTLQGTTLDMGLCIGLDFKDKTATINVDVSRKSAAIGAAAGAVLGGLIGFLAGGPPGIAIGAALGSTAGSTAGSTFNPKDQRTIHVGDNREEIKTKLLENGSKRIQIILTELNQQTIKQVISPIYTAVTTVRQQTLKFQNSIKEQTHV